MRVVRNVSAVALLPVLLLVLPGSGQGVFSRGLSARALAAAEAGTRQTVVGSISGRALDGDGGNGLAGVKVTVLSASSAPRQVVTGSSGAFAFDQLPHGTYRLSASRTGYADGAYGRLWPNGDESTLELGEGRRMTDVNVRVWKLAGVSGAVVDELGDALVGVKVYALLRMPVAGRSQLVMAGSGTTDDRGAYRLGSLLPGEYVFLVPTTQATVPSDVALMAPSSLDVASLGLVRQFNNVPVGPALGADSHVVYPTTFFGGTSRSASATSVVLGAGDERPGTDFQLLPVRGIHVTGTLVGPDGPAALALIQLLPSGLAAGTGFDTDFESARTVSDGRGAFGFYAIPPGQYLLRAFRAPLHGDPTPRQAQLVRLEAAVSALTRIPDILAPPTVTRLLPPPSDHSVCVSQLISVEKDDLVIPVTLSPAPRVSGRVVFKGTQEPPGVPQLLNLYVQLEATDGRKTPVDSKPGWVQVDGTFSTYGSFPGSYVMRIVGDLPGWHLRSAVYDGKDRLDAPLDLQSDDVDGAVVTFTDKATGVRGSVVTASGAKDPEATVLAFPVDQHDWPGAGVTQRRLRSARVSTSGNYSLDDIPAGDYFVVAVPVASARDWQEASVLLRLQASATHIHVDEGGNVVKNLTTVSRY